MEVVVAKKSYKAGSYARGELALAAQCKREAVRKNLCRHSRCPCLTHAGRSRDKNNKWLDSLFPLGYVPAHCPRDTGEVCILTCHSSLIGFFQPAARLPVVPLRTPKCFEKCVLRVFQKPLPESAALR